MARNRDYAAEYAARNAKAQEQGFQSYAAQRAFKAGTVEKRFYAAESVQWQTLHPDSRDWRQLNPKALAAFYEKVLEPSEAIGEGEQVTGRMRHDAVAYFKDYEEYSEAEAIAAMREIYGES